MQKSLTKIDEYLKENMTRTFEWGDFDCCLFACDIIVLAGGDDFAKDVRGTYTTELGSKRVLKKHFGSIEEAFSPLPEIDFNFVQRGDLVLFDTELGQVMGLHWANDFFAVSVDGMGVMKDISKPVKAWRVG